MIERSVIEGQRDALVAEIGKDAQRVFQPVVREAVGVVADFQRKFSSHHESL